MTNSLRTPKIKVGSEIKWSSLAGELAGIIESIELDYTGDGRLNPWFTINQVVIKGDDGKYSSYYRNAKNKERILGTHSYMKMMKVKIDDIPVSDWNIGA